MLRIWPLYFAIAGLALFVVPAITDYQPWESLMKDSYPLVIGLYMIILPNLLRATSIQVVGANQAWSVGVEEQFYAIWPWFVKWFHKRMVSFLVIFTALKLSLQLLLGQVGTNSKWADQLATILTHMQIEQMAVGALGAYWLFENKSKMLKLFYHPITHLLAWALFGSFFFVDIHFFGNTVFHGFVFLIIIMNVSTNDKFPLNLDKPILNKLGDYSYGIYMVHTLIIALLISFFESKKLEGLSFNLALYILSPILTVALAALSYHYFEKPFLNFKNRFAVVRSKSSS